MNFELNSNYSYRARSYLGPRTSVALALGSKMTLGTPRVFRGFLGPKKAQKWPKNGRPCNYINPYHPILAPPKKCKNVHFLGPKKGVIFTRALFTRLFYLYFWQTGGDIFGKGEKTAPRGHFSTFFPVLAGVMGLSTPILGGLKAAFFGQKTRKNGMFSAHPYDPEK